jgi:tripartite motif-containing protein 71
MLATPQGATPRPRPGDWQGPPGHFSGPNGIAIDDQGNIYVADNGYYRIQKLAPSGEPLAQWGTRGRGREQFEFPAGIAVDAKGTIYVADPVNDRIQKLSPGR